MRIRFVGIMSTTEKYTNIEFIENFNSLSVYKPKKSYEVRINGKLIVTTDNENYVNYIKSTVANALETGKNYLDLKYKLTMYKETIKYEG